MRFYGANLQGAELRGANLNGVDLSETVGLTQKQLDYWAIYDEETKLPPALTIKVEPVVEEETNQLDG